MTDLHFSRLLPPSADLNFGAETPPAVYLDITLDAMLVRGPMIAALGVLLDNAVRRGPGTRMRLAYQRAEPRSLAVSSAHQSPSSLEAVISSPVNPAIPMVVAQTADWSDMRHQVTQADASWGDGAPRGAVGAVSWAALSPRLRPALQAVFEAGTPLARRAADVWITLRRDHRPDVALPVNVGRSVAIRRGSAYGLAIQFWRSVALPWEDGGKPAPGISPIPGDPVTPRPPKYTPSTTLRFRARHAAATNISFKDPNAAGPIATVVVPVRRIYMQTNTTTLVLAEDGQPIPCRGGVQLGLDAGSWSWNWSASVPASYLQVLSAPVGDLVELIATVNGTEFRLAVESIKRDRRFAKEMLAVSGRSHAAWLADPYATIISRHNVVPMTARQLMDDALTENGVSIGWAVDWQITDWLVPAGSWSHTGTAMEACLKIAEAAGAYIQAHRTDRVLSVLPRYPVVPWHWAARSPDVELPDAVCVTEGIEWANKPNYNTVFISGEVGGILAHVTRQGTAGDKAAPMLTDALITHSDAGRQCGMAILSDTGRQKLITLSLPVLAETGIIVPGKLVRYVENGNSHLGLTRAVSVGAAFPKLRQSITLESHVI